MASSGADNRHNGHGQRLGITEPISFGGPTDYDVTKTHELEKVKLHFSYYWGLYYCIFFFAEVIIVDFSVLRGRGFV